VLGCVRSKAAGEDPEAPENDPLLLIEEVVAPVESGSEGALALGCGSRAANKDS
jgi:hypothetical protein